MLQKTPRRLALVLGLGRFGGGREAALFLARRGYALRIADRASEDSLRESVEALRELPEVDWCLGREDEALLDDVELLVANPAIPPEHPLLIEARRRDIVLSQEVELFLAHYPGLVVMVTGTNGKSSTTTLCARALEGSGFDVLLGGNIGHSLLQDESRWSPRQVALLEISSFQLERIDPARYPVEGAVFTRVTRDHLDRHGSIENYHAAKAKAAACAKSFVIRAADDRVAASFSSEAESLLHAAAPSPDAAAWLDAGWIYCGVGADPGVVAHRGALELIGEFQAENAMAAALLAARLGAERHRAALSIVGTAALPHRLQQVSAKRGLRWFDNGISTALESTLSAIEAIGGRIHWIGGGKSKDGASIYPQVAAALAPKLCSAQLFGDAAAGVQYELQALGLDCSAHDQLEQAAAAALERSRPGDAVLFSPAFASFDQFPNFRVRAERFLSWLDSIPDLD